MIKAVIFDVDGTLVDSVDLHAKAWQDVMAEFGHEIEFKKLRDQIGKGGDQLLPVFLSGDECEARGKTIETRRTEIMKERYTPQIRAFPDVRELFLRLRQEDIKILLGSSSKQEELQFYKKLVGIEDLVDAETSSDDAEKSKPHPDIFEAAIKQLPGIGAADIMVIGDTPYDAEAAAKAGLRTIGVLCGGFTETSLREAGCIGIYQDPADLLAQFDNWILS